MIQKLVKNLVCVKIVKNFFEKNKIFIAIIVGALIVGGAIYFFGRKERAREREAGDPEPTNRQESGFLIKIFAVLG